MRSPAVLCIFALLLVYGIQTEGESLKIYSSLPEDLMATLGTAFTEAHPEIEVAAVLVRTYVDFAGSAHDNPEMGLWVGGSQTWADKAKQDGLLLAYSNWEGWEFTSPSDRDPEGQWIGICADSVLFLGSRSGCDTPRSWADWADPQNACLLTTSRPDAPGGFEVLVAMLSSQGDPAPGVDNNDAAYLAQVYANIGTDNLTSGAIASLEKLVSDQASVCACSLLFATRHASIRGLLRIGTLVASAPEDGTLVDPLTMGLLRAASGDTLILAKVFYHWLLSAPAQTILAEYGFLPMNPSITSPYVGVTAYCIRRLPVNRAAYEANRGMLIAQCLQFVE
jgi:ABC-type Fe3+ transport system substrate-binding protein